MDGGIVIKTLISLLLAFFVLMSVSGIVTATEITIQPGPSAIQTAVNSAVSGDVIILKPGTYSENVKISTKSLTIKSYSGNPDDTIIKANKSTADIFLLQGNYIKISGLTFTGATADGRSAINMSKCYYCTIENNKLLSNSRGINLLYSHWNTISQNTATDNKGYGIVLGNATGNVISGNFALNNYRGVHFGNSDSNTLIGNTVRDNSVYGLFVCGLSDRNTIYNNYFSNINVTIKNGVGNVYNTAKTAGTNIIGGSYIGGNYWGKPDGTGFSQKAVDKNGDGIADSAYTNISGSIYSDSLPLVNTSQQQTSILPVANFDSNATSGSSPLTVLFTSTSTYADNVSWNFGDGTAAVNGTSVTHTFTNTGTSAKTFTVTLTAINLNGTSTKTGTVTVNQSATKPVTSFTVSPASGTTATTFTFTDTSTNTPSSWVWDFGDGSTANGNITTHTYSAVGTYTVSLTATNSAGSSTATKTITVSAITQTPVASFTVSPTSGTTATTFTFTDTSTNTPTSWAWNFGDGSTGNGNKTTHTYSAVGMYTVSLTATNSAGSSTATKTITVSGGTQTKLPVASFTISPSSGNTTTAFTFTDTSTNAPTSWSWKFGDSGTGSGNITTHAYSVAKTYTVSLTVRNSAGSSTATKTVTVSSGTSVKTPVASFSYSPSRVKKGSTIQFTDTSKNSPNQWTWTFSDTGETLTTQTASHMFSKKGSFDVTLVVSNDVGSKSVTKTIKVS
jgi:parallel beta-helix repeat protein